MVCDQGGVFRVVCDQGGVSPGWILIRVVSPGWCVTRVPLTLTDAPACFLTTGLTGGCHDNVESPP